MKVINKKPQDLLNYEFNNKTHNDKQINLLTNSIKEFGFNSPILIDKSNVIIAGHGRLEASKKLGMTEVPCVLVEGLTENQIKKYRLLDNKIAELAEDNIENIKLELDELNDLQLNELYDLNIKELKAEEDDYEIEEGIKTDIVKGDLFEIGEHRLLCGDSTHIDEVEKLMNGYKADMVFTDPPYGISHSGKGIKGNAEENDFGEILGDGDVNVAIDSFNLCYGLFPEATLIFWGANYYSSCLPNGFGWIVWDKLREGNTFSGAEIAFVNKGVKVDVFRHQWHGMIKASEHGEKRVHPTQKPIELVRWSFDNYNAGNNVLDLFGGSGSTMVACNQLKRKCYMMELDPKYCQVIINRMKKLDPTLIIKKNGIKYEGK